MLIRIIGVVGVLAAAAFLVFQRLRAQLTNEDPAYWEKHISKIEDRYGVRQPTDIVVFYGSSSIRLWDTLESDLAPISVVNHGFGGSKVADATFYVDRMVTPFDPRAVVVFTGTNDINGFEGSTKDGPSVAAATIELFNAIEDSNRDVPIVYLPISPSRARRKVWRDVVEANRLVEEYCAGDPSVTYVDVTEALMVDGGPDRGLLKWDGLHLNGKGYEIWADAVKPELERVLQKAG